MRGIKTAITALLAISLVACSRVETEVAANNTAKLGQKDQNEAVIDADSPKLAQIHTAPVEVASVPLGGVSAPGHVEATANRLSHVVLPVTGRVTSVLVKVGDYVRQGQPVLTVESADVDSAVSSYQQAQAAITQARSTLTKAQMDCDREQDLFQHGAVPQKDVLSAQALLVQAQTSLEQAQATSEQSKGRLQILGIATGTYGQRVTVQAPISGKVLEMSVVTGEFRNDLSAAVMTIADLSAVWVTSDVPETAIRFVKRGEGAQIELSAYPGEMFRGHIALIGDTVDPQTRTIKVRAELSNPEGRLKPDMFGTIQLAQQSESRPTVPSSAIISTAGKSLVWREKGPGDFEKVAVTTGAQVGDKVAILSGLDPHDRVVIDGVMLLGAN